MKQAWSVRIEGRPAKPVDPEDVLDRLMPYHPALSFGAGVLSVMTTLEADDNNPAAALLQAIADLKRAVPSPIDIELAEVMTVERQDQELERSNAPELVGIAEVAQMAGTSRQRAFQMTANRGFPVSLLELASGRLWSRPAIAAYLEEHRGARKPAVKSLTSQVGGNLAAARIRSKTRAVNRRAS